MSPSEPRNLFSNATYLYALTESMAGADGRGGAAAGTAAAFPTARSADAASAAPAVSPRSSSRFSISPVCWTPAMLVRNSSTAAT